MIPIQKINLPKIPDKRGNLSFIERGKHLPFSIARTYWIYDVPGGETRGGHAFYLQKEFIIAISGSFDVVINDGTDESRHHLNRSYEGLFVPNGFWRHMDNFSSNSIALVIASTLYDESDYIRDFGSYKMFRQSITNCPSQMVNKESTFTINQPPPKKSSVIELNKLHHKKGNITVIENSKHISFNTKRIYYLYDVPGGESRGGHAHKNLNQLVVATGGSFDVILDDGKEKQIVSLNRPYQGLHIIPGTWRELENFSSGATCLVLASEVYKESDYIRNYQEFINYKKKCHEI